VLSDHERQTLREVERRFLAEDPGFARAFEARQTRLSRHPRRLGARIALVTAALLTAFLLVAGSLGSALTVAVVTGLIWAVSHHPADTLRRTSWPAREGEPPPP
jgi:hypothetical protein